MRPEPRLEAGPIRSLAARPLAAAIVLCTGGWLTTPALGQHCGSYVSRPGDHVLKVVLGLSAVTDEEATPTPSSTSPDQPCSGPFCSRAPETPSPAPVPPAPSSVEHWAVLPRDRGAEVPSASPWPSSEPSCRPDRPIGGVFHPPRSR
ncbi:hypothetical protein [Tautonia sociabilis]|uniref:Uncharacterized protein n=1 Tax=Tautonia sociabilis TaxID=2080755 RepID=A0A432MIU4_9BACT|nr:hypothetical protein [Tautonia sociabilis]RUL87125.1 hypothetical protein TsocGM_13665 [Tautonia sociabilis]